MKKKSEQFLWQAILKERENDIRGKTIKNIIQGRAKWTISYRQINKTEIFEFNQQNTVIWYRNPLN